MSIGIQTRTNSLRIQNKVTFYCSRVQWLVIKSLVWSSKNIMSWVESSKLKKPLIRWFRRFYNLKSFTTLPQKFAKFIQIFELNISLPNFNINHWLWVNMIMDIYSLQLETSRSALLKICIVNVKKVAALRNFSENKSTSGSNI